MDEQNYLSEKILNILLTLRDQSVEEIANYDIKDEWDTVGTARCKAQHGGIHIPKDSSNPWIKKCCHYINCLDVDCDVALRSVVIYWLAFLKNFGKADGWRIERQENAFEKYQLRKDGEEMLLRGDTMNSYATPVIGGKGSAKGLLRRYFLNKYNPKMEEDGILSDGYFIDKYQQFSSETGDKIVWSAYILDKYKMFIKQFENSLVQNEISKGDVYKYIRVNDTLGNFIPVPFVGEKKGEFNRPRGTGKSQDFWDLALLCIYNYYTDPNEKTDKVYTLKWLLRSEKNADLCRNWLGMFETWDDFVEQNFMQDFVSSEQRPYGMPKELWKGHFAVAGTVMPEEEKHYNDFFEKASERIAARGIRIAIKIQEVLKDKDLTTLAEEMVYGNGKQ